ncbi:MAG: hypothetical protein ACXVW4_14615 [Nocardioides sp.]
MPRSPQLLVDPTPLDGPRLHVPSRIGWLLRTSRLAEGLSLRALAADLDAVGVRTSPTALSRIEAGGVRHGRVVDGYERRLGLPYGQLRAAIDVLCRTFEGGPADVAPHLHPPGLAHFSGTVAAVEGMSPTGGAWLDFAREHGGDRGFGITADRMAPLAARLAVELGRSVRIAYTTRYEALSRLGCGPYAEVVSEVVRDIVEAPDCQVVLDLMSAVSEHPSPSLLAWAAGLLSHPRHQLAVGGALAVQNMRAVGGLPPSAWADLVEPFVTAYDAADPARRLVLTRLFKTLPPATRTAVKARLSEPLAPVPGPRDWSRTRRNAHFALCTTLADQACASVGLSEQPMAARLLFEALFDFRTTRSATAYFLLLASPLADALHASLLDVAVDGPDELTRDAALGALMWFPGPGVPDVSRLLEAGGADHVSMACVLLGHAGAHLPDDLLESGLAGNEAEVRRALYCAGMSGDPRLLPLATAEDRPAMVRAAARWWLREGPRITV